MKRTLFFTLFLFASGNAAACKCLQYSIAERFAHASIVFVGSTTSDLSLPGKAGETISFQVSRWLKGAPSPGATIAIDPLFETDCTAPFISGVQLLVFASAQKTGAPIVGACSVRATEPIPIGGKLQQPSPEVIKFLQSVPNYSLKRTAADGLR